MDYYNKSDDDDDDVGSYSDASADYDENDRFARRYGDNKRGEHYDYQHSDEVSDQEDDYDEPKHHKDKGPSYKKRALSRYRRNAHDYDSDYDYESDATPEEEEEEDEKVVKQKRKKPLQRLSNKESTVQELILTHLTNLKTMILVSTQYLNRLEKKFKALVGNKMTSLQFKEDLVRMLEEFEEEDLDMSNQSDEESSSSSVSSVEDARRQQKKRKRPSQQPTYSLHDTAKDDDNSDSSESSSSSYDSRKKKDKKAFRNGIKRVKIVDSEDKPVDLKDLASNLGIKKPSNATSGRIVLGKGSDSSSDVVPIGTTLSNIPLVPGRKDPVLKSKPYVAPKNI